MRFILDFVDRQRSNIDMLASVGPREGSVIGGVARLPDRDDQMPLHRSAPYTRDKNVEEIILVLRCGRVFSGERVDGDHRPSNRGGDAVGVPEAERVKAVISGVGESG